MQASGRMNLGLWMTVTGIVVLVLAVLVFGLSETSNGETTVDWVNTMAAIGGLVLMSRGVYTVLTTRRS